jgi:hypothetical protein
MLPRVIRAGRVQWWLLFVLAVALTVAWPPVGGQSLAVKVVNWVVDPGDALPVLPGPFAPGQGDDLETVNAHDLQTRMYDELYARGGLMRLRLELKVASDPFDPATERQLLALVGVIAGFLIWRLGAES